MTIEDIDDLVQNRINAIDATHEEWKTSGRDGNLVLTETYIDTILDDWRQINGLLEMRNSGHFPWKRNV